MNIVYLVFGKELLNHKQAVFSILTLFPQEDIFEKIIVITDFPEYYKHLINPKLVIEKIDSDILKDWKGINNYIFRTKIKALELVANKWSANSLLYLDSDTFVFNKLNVIKHQLDQGGNIMHVNEGTLCNTKSKTKRSIWNQLRGNNYQGILIDERATMWNAGVIGISKFAMKKELQQVLNLCDNLCDEPIKLRLLEQLSFSLVLNKDFKLIPANNIIGHYWGNKLEWNSLINDFFIKSYLTKETLVEEVDRVKKMNLKETPVFVKTSSTSVRLKNIIDKLFVKTKKQFILNSDDEL